MRIFRVMREGLANADEYWGFVVVAEDEAQARRYHPNGRLDVDIWSTEAPEWPVELETLRITDLGEAAPGIERGVVLASFNAG